MKIIHKKTFPKFPRKYPWRSPLFSKVVSNGCSSYFLFFANRFILMLRRHLLAHGQQWKHQNNVWNLFKVNNRDTSTFFFLLTLNRFHTLFWCSHCWIWTSECRLSDYLCYALNWTEFYLKVLLKHMVPISKINLLWITFT